MSLPSYICKELPDGSYLGIYCHSSGEVARNGKMLCEHYTDEAKIDKLLALGDISNLAPNLEPDTPNDFSNACYAYCRDGGESYDHNKPQVVRLRNARKSGIKFMYSGWTVNGGIAICGNQGQSSKTCRKRCTKKIQRKCKGGNVYRHL